MDQVACRVEGEPASVGGVIGKSGAASADERKGQQSENARFHEDALLNGEGTRRAALSRFFAHRILRNQSLYVDQSSGAG
jgi:hypothetical protein